MPLSCFGLHDWCNPYFTEKDGVAMIECLSCGKLRTYNPFNDVYLHNEDEFFTRYQHQFQEKKDAADNRPS